MRPRIEEFREVWFVDFEFHAPPGEQPRPLCLVAREFHTGRLIRTWLEEDAETTCPIRLDSGALYVAYYASAELGCHLALGWPMPACVLDLFVEFRNLTNGRSLPCGSGLLGALAYYGLGSIDADEKREMRDLAMRRGSYSIEERHALLDYCQTDVDALAKLLPVMLPRIDLPRALPRGRYMAAAARMEWSGVPIDTATLDPLRRHWSDIQEHLIEEIDQQYGVFDGRSFRAERWAAYLAAQDIPWPRLDSGVLALDDETFRQMARRYPEQIGPMRELRHTLGQLRLHDLPVGSDGRNRCLLSGFCSRTGRNQPSNSRFIFGPSSWMRSLIKPEPGRALVYCDWSQQEFGIAAALSGDANMMAAYRSADPYLTFAHQAGAVPADATKQSHPAERNQFKICALAVQYGMGPKSLAESLGEPEIVGRQLLQLHRQTYPAFWRWSERAVNHAMLYGFLETVFGWRIHVGADPNPRSLANFPCQANGAEMLRLACCLATERGIQVAAPIHDALLVEGPVEEVEMVVSDTQQAMSEASAVVLGGFELRSDAEIVRFPDRYMDQRGRRMWETVTRILADLAGCERAEVGQPVAHPLGNGLLTLGQWE